MSGGDALAQRVLKPEPFGHEAVAENRNEAERGGTGPREAEPRLTRTGHGTGRTVGRVLRLVTPKVKESRKQRLLLGIARGF